MYEELALLELAIWVGLPAWIANSTPVLGGGGRPIDGEHYFRDGRRLLGKGKTIRGFLVGIIFGTLIGVVQFFAAPYLRPLLAMYVTVTAEMDYVLFMQIPTAILMSFGALVGDLVGSFIKRRVNIKSGDPSPVMDQLGFIIMALIFAAPIFAPSPVFVIILVIVTFFVHWFSNVLGYLLGLKNHPW
jgi:CDP-2,3-bis-(O-geranylgeranyl)-sn-glycerol synthase